MNGIGLTLLIILIIIGVVAIYKIFKPYFIRYDTTICINGGLGAGKTLTSVKTAVVLIRKQRFFKYKCYNFFARIKNWFIRSINKHRVKLNNKHSKDKNYVLKKYIDEIQYRKKPMLYSNIPIHFKKSLFGFKREWSKVLTAPMLMCLEEITEYSVVMIDELPQFINQFNWDEELIQKNVNEFITFFRHLVGGYFIVNCQNLSDVVVQIRRKLNQAIWCFDCKVWPLPFIPIFYTCRMCDIMLGEEVQTMSTTYIEENTRIHFGLMPAKNTYNSRCYSERYKNIYKDTKGQQRFSKIKTNKVLRLMQYESPLDDTTTYDQKQKQWIKGEKIWKN